VRICPRRICGVVGVGVSVLAVALPALAQNPSGLWDAVLIANNVEVPFRFEVAVDGASAEAFFFDGDRKVGSTSGSFENGKLTVEYDYLNTVLEATLDGDRLRGTYGNAQSTRPGREFHATRFMPASAQALTGPSVEGTWEMYKSSENNFKLDVSWRLYLRESGSEVSGAILKTSGDTGTLVGRWTNGTLVMSHFAGARPLLFEAVPNPDGTLEVTLDRGATFRAARTSEARDKGIPAPPDLTRFTSVKDPTEPFHFSGVDTEGTTMSDADARFEGKVVILAIGGTWCPNCHDEAPSLVELDKEFRDQGLEVVGLFFEGNADLAVAKPRVTAFIRRYGVEFPILVAGTRDEGAEKLSQLNNFAVYPTTVFLGRDGRVRSVHAGFASEATGDEHERLIAEQRALVQRLLAESHEGE